MVWTRATDSGSSTSTRTFRAASPPLLRTRTVNVPRRPAASATGSGTVSQTSAAVPWKTVATSSAARILRASVALATTTRRPVVFAFSP